MTDGRLRGCDSGIGSDTDLDALTDLSVHRSLEFVCLCSANETDSSLPRRSRCPHGGAVSKNTHETHKGQHDVIQFPGAMDELPTTAQTEYCIGQCIHVYTYTLYTIIRYLTCSYM